MGGAVRGAVRSVSKVFGGGGSKPMTPTTITNNISTSGLGTLDNKEAVTAPEEKKLSTLNKKKLGSKGAVIPLQSTATNPVTSGVQI
jgi:hypothetical protein